MKQCGKCGNVFALELNSCPACGWEPAVLEGFVSYAPELAYEGQGYHPELFDLLAGVEENYFWFKQRATLIRSLLKRHHLHMGSWLEIGFGTGHLLNQIASDFPDAAIYGSDVFIAGLKHNRCARAEVMQVDALNIPFVDAFDGIGAFDVLEHIEGDKEVIRQVHKALKPGGVFCVTVPQHRWLWSAADDHAHHVRRYTPKELRQKMENEGFEIVRDTSFVTFLLPAMLLSRLRSRQEYDAHAEFSLPAWLNRVFSLLMGFDRWLVIAGFSLPIGGSRLVLARKPER